MTNTETRELVYLAGLLHDIGKFYQRADPDGVPKSKLVSEVNRKSVSTYCPTDGKGNYTHKHVIWTLQFFDDHRSLFENALGIEATQRLIRLAASHHKPDAGSIPERIVQKADHYSSGIDRTSSAGLADESEELKAEQSGRWDAFKNVRMQSIFETLLGQTTVRYRQPIASIQLTKDFFPKKSLPETAPAQYKTLYQSFREEVSALPPQSADSLVDSLLYLLEKYTVTIPGSTQHLPDVSLFDHLKSTAALSLCLYDYWDEQNKLASLPTPAEAPLLLIGGDLSGIQAFIYDIIGKSAAKNLKGRSFYLQLLTDSLVRYLLDGLRLHRANIIYSSGGGFYLLAPNTAFIRQELPGLQASIQAKLRQEHGVRLFLAIDCEPVTETQIFDQQIGEVWSNLTGKLSARKQNRFANFLATDEGYRYFFEPDEVGGESRGNRDAITGEEFSKDERKYPLDPDTGTGERGDLVRKATWDQIRLGKLLREQIQYQVTTKGPISYWEDDERDLNRRKTEFGFEPLGLGQHHYFISAKRLDKLRSKLKGSVNDATVLSINTAESTGFTLPGNRQINGFTFYGGNDAPRDLADDVDEEAQPGHAPTGRVLYFDQLAGDASLKRLGILRMDVDNLGNIFKNGFDTNRRTFSRYSALSRSLDYFFKGYLNYLWKTGESSTGEAFHQHTFILYAGGDDLFIIGKWNVVLAFAGKIQTDFREYVCENPALSISGGMALVPSRFPIAKAAGLSELEEKQAKGHHFEQTDKNAISFLGTPLCWIFEFETVERIKNDLIRFIRDEPQIPKGLLTKISTLYAMKQEQEKQGQNPRWQWMAAYDLGRAVERAKTLDAKAFFRQLQQDLFTNKSYQGQKLRGSYEFLDLLNIAARWAELEMRS